MQKACSAMAFAALALCAPAMGQVRVNGVVPGKLWRTHDVSGEVEVFHIWGRTTVVPVREAWVNIIDEQDCVSVGARCDNPVLEGKARTGYGMAYMSGPINRDFPGDKLQTIVNSGITSLSDTEYIYETKTAMIPLRDGEPVSVWFTCVEHALFDVPAAIAERQQRAGFFSDREIESLRGFDAMGFRQRTFQAVFKGGE